jgi:hypothetical protein
MQTNPVLDMLVRGLALGTSLQLDEGSRGGRWCLPQRAPSPRDRDGLKCQEATSVTVTYYAKNIGIAKNQEYLSHAHTLLALAQLWETSRSKTLSQTAPTIQSRGELQKTVDKSLLCGPRVVVKST